MLDTTIRAGRAPLLALATAASVVALTATAPQADAAFVIDTFDTFASTGLVTPTTSGSTDSAVDTDIPRSGDTRTISVTGTPIFDRAAVVVSESRLEIGLFDAGTGSVELAYDFGSGLDLSGHGDLLSFNFVSSDLGGPMGGPTRSVDVGVTVEDSDSSDTQTFTLQDGGPSVNQLAFAAYSGIDFADVSKLTVVFDGASFGADFSLDQIAAVPLPGALPLFLGGLAGVGYVVRRRQRQAAAA